MHRDIYLGCAMRGVGGVYMHNREIIIKEKGKSRTHHLCDTMNTEDCIVVVHRKCTNMARFLP